MPLAISVDYGIMYSWKDCGVETHEFHVGELSHGMFFYGLI